MQEAINKATTLVEALAYIRRFDGRIIVVKVGGSIMDEPGTLHDLLVDVCFMHAVGMRPIIVHGGGKSITEAMRHAGLEAHFVHGRRYTDERTLAIAEHVLINEINRDIVQQVRQIGPRAMGLHSLSSCAVFAKRLFLEVQEEGAATRRVDMGFVGEVDWVNAELFTALTDARTIPVVAPIARDASGGKLNVNADSVAGHIAAAVHAEKLVLVSDTHGIRTSEEAKDFAPHLTQARIVELIDQGVISAGMLPKVEAALVALQAGVAKVHVIDGRVQHSLMLEVYTDKGIGTEIVRG